MDEEPEDVGDVRNTIAKAVMDRSTGLPALIEAQYTSLLAMARRIYSREDRGNSLSPTILVHEAYRRLVGQPKVTGQDSVFFRSCFAQECRRVLVEHARRRNALRRGGDGQRESLGAHSELGISNQLDLVYVNDAIESLAKLSPRMARIVDLRVFGEMTVAECAETLGVSPRTVDTDWSFARSWLQRELG